jgi:hypothetical protein
MMAGMETVTLARCTERGCPWRYRSGPDRPCPVHAGDDGGAYLTARAVVPATTERTSDHDHDQG